MNTLNIRLDNNNNEIINLEEVLAALQNINNDLNSIEYLESLLNYMENQDINNKSSLIDAIRAKLLEFKSLNDNAMSSKDALDQAKRYNEDLKRINVISTSKYDNDSKKDIEYISITHEDGSVEMLVCAGSTAIGKYISEHASDVATKSADEIFKYFKETVHNELRFYKESEIDNVNPTLANQALVKEDDIKALEVEEVEKYAERIGIEGEVQVTVDPNGERIYMVADAIIKFHSDYDGNRVMDVLQESKIAKLNKESNRGYEDLMNELDGPENNDIFTNYESAAVVNTASPSVTDEFVSINFEQEFQEFDLERLKGLLIKRDVYEQELTAEELAYIRHSIAFLIGTMLKRAENNELASDEAVTLDDYMRDIVAKYQAIEDGRLAANELSETDKELAHQYLENMERIEALGLKNKPKMLELKDEDKKSGMATAVILLEMLVIAVFVIVFLSIDI